MRKLYMHEAFPARTDRPRYRPHIKAIEPEVEVDDYPYQVLIRTLEGPEPVTKLGFKNKASASHTFSLICHGIDERGEAKTVTLMHNDEALEVY